MSTLMSMQDITDNGDLINICITDMLGSATRLDWDAFCEHATMLASMYDSTYSYIVEAVRHKMISRWVLKTPTEGTSEHDAFISECLEFTETLMKVYHLRNLMDAIAPRLISDDNGDVKTVSSVFGEVEFTEYSVHYCDTVFGVKEEEDDD